MRSGISDGPVITVICLVRLSAACLSFAKLTRGDVTQAGDRLETHDRREAAPATPALLPALRITHDQFEIGQLVVVGRCEVLRARRDGDDHVHEGSQPHLVSGLRR